MHPVKYPDLINVKNFVQALEDIAEAEQTKLADKPDNLPEKTDYEPKLMEAVRFVKSSRSKKSPKQSKQILGTIEEAVNETAFSVQNEPSVRDDESKVGSSKLEDSGAKVVLEDNYEED